VVNGPFPEARIGSQILDARSNVNLVLALKAFFDETGHVEEPTDEFLGLAGFVAPASKWLDLEPRWRAILENAGVSWFHAVDFAHFRGEFTGWQSDGDARRIALAKTLLSTITEAGGMPTPIAAILSTADYKSLPVEVQSCMRYEPYLHCFQQVARGAALEAKYEAPDERTSAVFAESDYSGMARELWAALRNLPSDEQKTEGDQEAMETARALQRILGNVPAVSYGAVLFSKGPDPDL
jgi:hypothetical protein